jgi:hypothetical protein
MYDSGKNKMPAPNVKPPTVTTLLAPIMSEHSSTVTKAPSSRS